MAEQTTDLSELWTQALTELTEQATSAAGRTWLEQTEPVGWSDDTVVLATRDSFAREQLDLRYGTALRNALSRAAGRAVSVVVTVAAGSAPAVAEQQPEVPAVPARAAVAASTSDGDTMLNPNYVFDRFVIGASNRFAHAAAFAVAEAPAKAYNPLFVYGDAGLGKTHLLQAIGHYARHLSPSLKVRYVTTEQFTNEFIDAIQNNRRQPFQRRYRDIDVLLIDDIQFIQTRERTQEEFFHTFNTLHTAEKQIVVTCDRPPKAIGLEERLRTRFEWGLITDVQPPDIETRIAILRKRAEQEARAVPDAVLEQIASRISSNIRELEGAFIRVAAYASLQRTDITPTLATVVLKDLFPDERQSAISISLIMSETATYMGFTLDELCSKSRTRDLVRARQIAMYVTRELTELSLPKIGEAFGGRDHSTVLHAQRKIAGLMGERAGIYEQVQELTSRIKQAARRAR